LRLTPLPITALAIALSIASIALPVIGSPASIPQGLIGRYFGNAHWEGQPLVERVDVELSTATVASVAEVRSLPVFSVEWSGYLVADTTGIQRFATKSDDGSWLWIDDRLIVDNGGRHSALNASGEIHLTRGVHRIRVRFQEMGGGYSFQVGQTSTGGVTRHPARLVPEPMTWSDIRQRELAPLAAVAFWYLTAFVVGLAVIKRVTPNVNEHLRGSITDRVFLAVSFACTALIVAHITYGLPAYEPLTGDELDPLSTLFNSRTGFDGWNLRWPVLHPGLLAIVLAPFSWAEQVWALRLLDLTVVSVMFVVIRLVSVAMLFGTLLLTFDAARRLFDRRAALLAVALLGLSPLIVFFGSFANLEIPHLFWVTASFWAWVRFHETPSLTWCLILGALVGISVAVKDQAYGFFIAAPFAIILTLWRQPRGSAGAYSRIGRVIAVGVATFGAFALGQGLPWLWDRFVAHLDYIVGSDVTKFQMFSPTPAGHLALATATVTSFLWALGIPLALAFAGALVRMVFFGERRNAILLLPALTYYLGFLSVVLYVYDRFLIGLLPIVAMLGGRFLAWVTHTERLPRLIRMAVPAAVVAVAAINAVGANAAFFKDPRHDAARWLADAVPCGSSVGLTYDRGYVPALDCYDVWTMIASDTETLVRFPEYFVFNEGYVNRLLATPSGSKFLKRLRSGELGFTLIKRFESTPPWWAPMYWEQRFRNTSEDALTIADKPFHAIEVWKRG
jgi:hypothetical protein